MSTEEFAAWVMEERIKRDVLIRLTRGVDVLLCDRSFVCVLAFIESNRKLGNLREAAPKQYDYLMGDHIHLVAEPETILYRLANRGDRLAANASDALKHIVRSEQAYAEVYAENKVPRLIVSTQDRDAKEVAGAILERLGMAN